MIVLTDKEKNKNTAYQKSEYSSCKDGYKARLHYIHLEGRTETAFLFHIQLQQFSN